MSAGAAHSLVRTARALYRGPLTGTAQALSEGAISVAHAQVLAAGTHDLPTHVAVEAEPVLLEVARRLDPPRLRQAITHLRLVADPEGADTLSERQHQRRGLWVSPTWEGMVAVNGLLDPEAGQTLLAALEPLARPANADDDRSGGQRRADALAELARRQLEGGRLPQSGGVRPQLLVAVDLDSLVGHPGGVGGEAGGVGPLDPEACRRLACDGVVSAAQRAALVVRDGDCAVAGCERPPGWCEAHHLVHWLHGDPTNRSLPGTGPCRPGPGGIVTLWAGRRPRSRSPERGRRADVDRCGQLGVRAGQHVAA